MKIVSNPVRNMNPPSTVKTDKVVTQLLNQQPVASFNPPIQSQPVKHVSSQPPPQTPFQTPIVVEPTIKVDDKILQFFESSCLDPIKFIHQCIENHIVNMNLPHQPNVSEITKKELVQFQSEYDLFIEKKKSLVLSMRETSRQLDAIKLENFDAFLSKKFGKEREVFPCTICNLQSYGSKKALSTHQRKCRRENVEAVDEDEENAEV
jgi:hypothetical protein